MVVGQATCGEMLSYRVLGSKFSVGVGICVTAWVSLALAIYSRRRRRLPEIMICSCNVPAHGLLRQPDLATMGQVSPAELPKLITNPINP